jgi:hypothetical protein
MRNDFLRKDLYVQLGMSVAACPWYCYRTVDSAMAVSQNSTVISLSGSRLIKIFLYTKIMFYNWSMIKYDIIMICHVFFDAPKNICFVMKD